MKFIKLAVGALALICSTAPSVGQGFSFQTYYSPEFYGQSGQKGHPQNWTVYQDSNGYIYTGSGNGLNFFDGLNWGFDHIGERGRGLSFFESSNKNIYVSGSTNFGKLIPDSLNRIKYQSISDHFYSKNAEHPSVWSIYEIDGKIYFCHLDGIGVYNPSEKTFSNFQANERFGRASFLKDNTIIIDGDSGLWAFNGSSYSKVSGSEVLGEARLLFGIKVGAEKYLLGTIDKAGTKSELWVYDGKEIQSFDTEVSSYLEEKLLFDAILIDSQTIAIATIYGGVIFTNEDGEILKVFNEKTGLYTNSVFDLFLDREKTLWMGLAEGIQTLQLNSHIQNYSEWAGIEGDVTDIAVEGDNMFVFAYPHIYRKELAVPENVLLFKPIDYQGQIAGFVTFRNRVYLYDNTGLYEIGVDGTLTSLYQGPILEHIEKAKEEETVSFITPTNILIFDGLRFRSREFSAGNEIGYAVKYKQEVFVTIGHKTGGTGIAKIQDGKLNTVPVKFDSSNVIRIIKIGVFDGKLYAGAEGGGSNSGLYEYHSDDQVFRKSEFLGEHPDFLNKQVYNFEQCSQEVIWFTANKKILKVKEVQNEWRVYESPYQQVSKNPKYTMRCAEGGIWIGSTNNLSFIPNKEWNFKSEFRTNITGIYIRNDSLIYGGFGEPQQPIVLPYANNELRFSYAAASYVAPDRNQYQVKLEGFDSDWSTWTSETQKDYTNIPEGEYMFRVRSKNVYDVAGISDAIPFEILPPWYRTWWAYLLYTFTIAGILYLAYKIRINQILRVQRIRNNIASDLHDEVSATLSSISYFAEAIKSDKLKKDKSRFVNLIANSADDAKEKITDIVWAINPEHDDWLSFLSKCRRFTSDLLESKEMDYSLKIDEFIPGKLDMQLRQHLWLIFKEMVTNAVRHSQATQLDVIMKYEDGELKLVVQDNGEGMDVDNVRKGNGLVNIHKRAEQINGEISLKTSEGFGTRWMLKVPL
ncbi:ATP-binding protein [Gracilimonas sediminicola]|uniref:ATP-binding protein n=1 Tax=Gracilimonas sediminicola TaxID=2952158 RepID=A0A9X2L5C8_9BACT|nr:ATP-binding protein [Gracilimonas sediminicola]MCP9292599.1 ATP-binding protein [Gracilimonas sediminicola]